MSRPDDIPEDVWDAASEAQQVIFDASIDLYETGTSGVDPQAVVARAILAERERCAAIADGWDEGLEYDLEPEATVASSVTAKSIAAAIRKGGE